MPTPLIEATYDFRIKKSIDEATYDQRIGISFVQKSVPTRTVTCQCAVRPSDDLPPSLVRYAIQWAMLLGAPKSSSYPLTLKRSAPTSPRYPSHRRPVQNTDRTFTTAAPSGTRCTQRLETPSRGSTGMSRMPTTRRSINRREGGRARKRPNTSLPRCSLCRPTFERSKHSSENKARMKV